MKCLSKKLKGLTRRKLVEEIKIADSGMVTEALDNLEKCDFIRRYKAFGKRQRDVLYQLTDMYTLFYLRFVKGYNGMNEKAWSSLSDGKRNSWAGYAFEQVCLIHLNQIKKALGISGIASDVCSWNSANDGRGAQVDLVIDRSDKVINLCEMKYTTGRFELTRTYAEWMSERKELFRNETSSKKTLHLTLITPYGIVLGKNTSALQNIVTIGDLFE